MKKNCARTVAVAIASLANGEHDEHLMHCCYYNAIESVHCNSNSRKSDYEIKSWPHLHPAHQHHYHTHQSPCQRILQSSTSSSFIYGPNCTMFIIKILILLVIFFSANIIVSSAFIYDGVSEYQVIEGDTISLPCNISTNEWNENQISLVVWYRSNSNQGNPIYSIDSRGVGSSPSSSRSRHQVMPQLDGRIRMDFQTNPPVLHIDSVQINDAGDYRCRVDYRMNRTKHFLIHLNVSVLPKSVSIRDLFGNVVQGMTRTPYNEGDKVSLYCDAIGGSPAPIVIWKNNDGKIIDDSYELLSLNNPNANDNNGTTTRNLLEIPQLDRSHLLQEITCEAYPPFLLLAKNSSSSSKHEINMNNWTISETIDRKNNRRNNNNHHHYYSSSSASSKSNSIKRTSVVLDLNLRPLSVQIQVPNFQPNLNRSATSSLSSGTLSSSSQSQSSSSSSSSQLSMVVVPSGYHSPTLGNVLVVSAGKKTEIECRTWGSRPPAEITWWRGSRRLPTAASRTHYSGGSPSSPSSSADSSFNDVETNLSEQQTSNIHNQNANDNNNNLTISTLTYIAAPEDDSQRLTCRADNLHLEHEEIEDSVIISVRYAPQLTLSLGAKIPENIREGSDVYFECQSKSNPPLTEVVWLFEGKPLVNDPISGVLVTNQSLVMQRVRREHRGNYQCAASNPEGISASNKVFLNVHFAPVCKPTQTIIYGVARTEHIIVSCQVEAEPITPIQFRWFFNNSYESYELPNKDFTMELLQPDDGQSQRNKKLLFNNADLLLLNKLSLESVFHSITNSMNRQPDGNHEPNVARSNATYSPRSRIGYGLLFCMAENSVGQQRDPCVFTIVEAGPPNSVHDCRIANVTMASFILECAPGENGGLRQIFHLEVYNIEKEHLQVNVTSLDDPIFSVENLPHDTAFMLNVFSSNAKGRSDSVTLRTATSAYAAKHTTNGKKHRAIIFEDINQLVFNPIFGALVVALISLVLLCMATVVFIRSRLCPPTTNHHHPGHSSIKPKGNDTDSTIDHQKTIEFKDDSNKYSSQPTETTTVPCSSLDQYMIHHHRSSPFTESHLNQSTAYYDYHHATPPPSHLSHTLNGPMNPSLSTSDSTALTDMSSVVNLNNNNSSMVATATVNNEFMSHPTNTTMAIAQQTTANYRCNPAITNSNLPSDLMTNAFTYNIHPQTSTPSSSTNAIYPMVNDGPHTSHHLLKINPEIPNCHAGGNGGYSHISIPVSHPLASKTNNNTIARHIQTQAIHHHGSNITLLRQPPPPPTTTTTQTQIITSGGHCFAESLSSNSDDKTTTNELIDEEWSSHHSKHSILTSNTVDNNIMLHTKNINNYPNNNNNNSDDVSLS